MSGANTRLGSYTGNASRFVSLAFHFIPRDGRSGGFLFWGNWKRAYVSEEPSSRRQRIALRAIRLITQGVGAEEQIRTKACNFLLKPVLQPII